MNKTKRYFLPMGILLLATILLLGGTGSAPAVQAAEMETGFAPLIEANLGQFSPQAEYVLKSAQGALWFNPDSIWLRRYTTPLSDNPDQVQGSQFRLSFPGANPEVALEPISPQAAQFSYLVGEDPSGWATQIPTYAGMRYRDLYPGVNLVFRSSQSVGQPGDWYFEAREGADLAQVQLRVEGADDVSRSNDVLNLSAESGNVRIPLPGLIALDGTPVEVLKTELSSFEIVRNATRSYDLYAPFVPDIIAQADAQVLESSTLGYSTFLGGADWDVAYDLAVDEYGQVYVTGRTPSIDFPTTAGAFSTSADSVDVFVAKLNQSGTGLVYATFIGGSGQDSAYGIAVEEGIAYLVGDTWSQDFPLAGDLQGENDVFVLALEPAGAVLRYVALLGGSDQDYGNAIAVEDGQVYITGSTTSEDIPTEGYRGEGDAYLAKFDAGGSLAYLTLFGGREVDAGYAIAVRDQAAYVTGATWSLDFPAPGFKGNGDILFARFDPSGEMVFASMMGGIGEERGTDLVLDGDGNIFLSGWTGSPDLQGSRIGIGGGQDAVLLQLDPGGALVNTTLIGGTKNDRGQGLVLDGDGGLTLGGTTDSSNLPVTAGAFQRTLKGAVDLFLAHLQLEGGPALLELTYFGGSERDQLEGLGIDPAGNVYLTGSTRSSDYPVTENALGSTLSGSQDAFLTRFGIFSLPTPPTAPTPLPTFTPPPPTPTPTATDTAEPVQPTDALATPTATSESGELAAETLAEQPGETTELSMTASPQSPEATVEQPAGEEQTLVDTPVESLEQTPVGGQLEVQPTEVSAPVSSGGSGFLWILLPVALGLGLGGWWLYRAKFKK